MIGRAGPAIFIPRRSRPIAARATTDQSAPEPGGGFGLVGFQTWTEVDGIMYGAKPDLRGPIGGHEGYTEIVTSGDVTANNLSQLQAALADASPGDVVFIPGDVEIDLSNDQLTIPGGVTLASDRGSGGSDGALLFTNKIERRHLVDVTGGGVRVTGLRFRGPPEHHEPGLDRDEPETRAIWFTTGSNHEVDNCEIYDFVNYAANFDDRSSSGHYCHHNYVHHIHRAGAGYGFVMDQCGGLFEYNLFNACRHVVAHSGRNPVSNPGDTGNADYTAQHNVELDVGMGVPYDMHSSPEDPGTLGSNNGGRAGIMRLRNNFAAEGSEIHAVGGGTSGWAGLRGTPYDVGSEFTHNWIPHGTHWSVNAIMRLYEEVYSGGEDLIDRNENLWAGEDKIVRI